MTFCEMEDVIDGKALLEYEGKLYVFIQAAIDLVKPIGRCYFESIDGEDGLVFTKDQLRGDSSLHARY